MTMAKAKIKGLQAKGGIGAARQYAELCGESFPAYVAQAQWDYFIEQLSENEHLRDSFHATCKNEYFGGWQRKRLEVDMLSSGWQNIEKGDFGRVHEKWLKANKPSLYEELTIAGDLCVYLARQDLRERVKANVSMNFAMRYAQNAIPDKHSAEWTPYILKLRSLARDYIRQTSPML